jgi:hypothetical protein
VTQARDLPENCQLRQFEVRTSYQSLKKLCSLDCEKRPQVDIFLVEGLVFFTTQKKWSDENWVAAEEDF